MTDPLPHSAPSGSRPGRPTDPILSAVLDDLRTTLRVPWVDPALRALADEPTYLAAAWAAVRPNITRSFAAGAERLQRQTADVARRVVQPHDGSGWVREELGSADRELLLRTAQALHHSSARVYLVVQTWAVLARRQAISGTGREEPPARRGIPSWQEGLIGPPRTLEEGAEALVDVAITALGLTSTPAALAAIGRWPPLLERVVADLRKAAQGHSWSPALNELRRTASEVLGTLPHPMDLQWDVLATKGLTEERRRRIAEYLTAATSSMPASAIIAATVWVALGAPELPTDF